MPDIPIDIPKHIRFHAEQIDRIVLRATNSSDLFTCLRLSAVSIANLDRLTQTAISRTSVYEDQFIYGELFNDARHKIDKHVLKIYHDYMDGEVEHAIMAFMNFVKDKAVSSDDFKNIASRILVELEKAQPIDDEMSNGLAVPADKVSLERYIDRPKGEAAPDFIKRVYGGRGLLSGEFSRADLRREDPQAYMGLSNWERKNGRADIDLPTLKEANDRAIAERTSADREREREMYRLQSARQRRKTNRSSLT